MAIPGMGIVAAGFLGFALLLVGGKAKAKPRPPVGGGGGPLPPAPDPAAPAPEAGNAGNDAIANALGACPDREAEILAAAERYGVRLTEDPELAYAELRAEICELCPEACPAFDEMPEDVADELLDEARVSTDPDRINDIRLELADGGALWHAQQCSEALTIYYVAVNATGDDEAVYDAQDEAARELRFDRGFIGLASLLEANLKIKGPTRGEAEQYYRQSRPQGPNQLQTATNTLHAWGYHDLAGAIDSALAEFFEAMQLPIGDPQLDSSTRALGAKGFAGLAAMLVAHQAGKI